ncbi:hypothetical protein C8F04DRAFT_1398643 [Mycena alexandri]|uniref:Uncharacterized protein n=1 Tax=Mycena alexandri TaxID=1745969 RepID=A0AAD6SK32_9AGAR|nr:hypothetical protein C8F04DRAFT_1398643 [Mycena alexandri]
MAPLRLFRSSTKEWVSPLIAVARGLVSVGNCVPFPYVGTALASGLALLELIETVGQSGEDLKYLAESVVTIMRLLSEEIDVHPTTQDTKFYQVCVEFNMHLTQLSKDLESMSRSWSSSKLKKYLNSRNIRDEIAQFTRRVNDVRANATLVAAAGTRLDLAAVAIGVTAVESRISDLQRDLIVHRPPPATESLKQELVRFEEDFHALKLGDIHLDFGTARTVKFTHLDFKGRDGKQIGWTDYTASVNGGIHTVRVYQGSDPTESWMGFLSFLADNSPSPHLPQLFGFCSSPKLRSLVFHGEYRTLDEYAAGIPLAPAIVDWELNLVRDLACVLCCEQRMWTVSFRALDFAMVNAQDGKLLLSHIDSSTMDPTVDPEFPPFLGWFRYSRRANIPAKTIPKVLGCPMRDVLRYLVDLQRSMNSIDPLNETLKSRGRVYHFGALAPTIGLTQGREITPGKSWAVRREVAYEVGSEGLWSQWPPENCWPSVGSQGGAGFTHFILPVTSRWISLISRRAHCGYFMTATLEFGGSVPDITTSWLAQASSIVSKLPDDMNLSDFYVPTHTKLVLSWEMVFLAEATPIAPESIAVFEDLPKQIHIFVEIPAVPAGHVQEPQIYWSTDPDIMTTSAIPLGGFEIRMVWDIDTTAVRWESHHYEVAKLIQEQNGFNPATNDAARSLGLPLLDIEPLTPTDRSSNSIDSSALSDKGMDIPFHFISAKDPHTLQYKPCDVPFLTLDGGMD